MRREQRLARLFRALIEDTQDELAEKLGVFRTLISQFENGDVVADPEHLEAMAKEAGITVGDGEKLLRVYETQQRARRRWGRSADGVFERMAAGLRSQAEAAYRRFLTLPLPDRPPKLEDRERVEERFARLEGLSEALRLELMDISEGYRTWALCERVCAASVRAASRDLDAAAGWAHLAVEMAERVRALESFRRRLRGYALAHAANVLRVKGDLEAADAEFEQAKRLWLSGSDPDGVLDPGRLLDLEASLRRSQRRLGEALARLEEAEAVGRCRERILVKKGFTLEVMGDYEGAVAALLEAEPLAERAGDPRLLYMARFNLAVVLTHLGRYGEAAELARHVRDLATARGDGNEVPRVTWLEGRIAAGLGRTREALRLLAEARREFERRKMSYDVALALLEEAVLLLEEGRTSEVQALAEELTKVFAANGVHREALAALRLFHEAAEREEATAELARRVLRFLFRARHDPELRFEEPER